jgi:5-formyltetrahydrofolate cyclo-ligase
MRSEAKPPRSPRRPPPAAPARRPLSSQDAAETKQLIREGVWRKLDALGVSTFPRPVRGRIPNVKDADAAAERLAQTPEWRAAQVVKVNPDAPQRGVRFRALKQGKTLLMPTPRLREGFLLLDPAHIPANRYFAASSISGAFTLARSVSLDELPQIDLLVFGSVAVTPEGDRVGKGEGYAELEFAVLRTLDRIPASIVIATTVHDEQLVDAIPRQPFDVSLDLICTPSQTIRVRRCGQRPPGVLWDQLPEERRHAMPILEELYQRRL